MNIASLQIPAFLHIGKDSTEQLAGIIDRVGAHSAALFTDKGVKGAGLCDRALEILRMKGIKVQIFDSVVAEPSVADVMKVIDQAAKYSSDLLVAIGGGSTMDTAKLASVLIGAPYTIYDLLNDPSIARKMVPTVMIPTTCGTGSEATCNAIVAIPEESSKKGIVNGAMIPDEVILDVNMIARLPKGIVAATGVDALAHCVECYTSNKATSLSNLYAKAGAKLIFGNLVQSYRNPDDLDAKMNMMLGAFYGGVAITGSGTTAVHALSYPLGGKYHIAHGVSNAILFAQVMAFNRNACIKQLAELCDVIEPGMYGKSAETKSLFVVDRIATIVKDTEIPVTLDKFGVQKEDLDFLVTAGSQQQRLLVNNPKKMNLDDIRKIYESVL
ncbi:MAG: iron-containing alcohol dehydrogenase [Spirochaetia bacterium]|jgi:alcohol dehydrogenase class IV|nr:iron-containing alcohol dehydrogenase [Spirochaetia bacterium]